MNFRRPLSLLTYCFSFVLLLLNKSTFISKRWHGKGDTSDFRIFTSLIGISALSLYIYTLVNAAPSWLFSLSLSLSLFPMRAVHLVFFCSSFVLRRGNFLYFFIGIMTLCQHPLLRTTLSLPRSLLRLSFIFYVVHALSLSFFSFLWFGRFPLGWSHFRNLVIWDTSRV